MRAFALEEAGALFAGALAERGVGDVTGMQERQLLKAPWPVQEKVAQDQAGR
jgi:hypothetical protein